MGKADVKKVAKTLSKKTGRRTQGDRINELESEVNYLNEVVKVLREDVDLLLLYIEKVTG